MDNFPLPLVEALQRLRRAATHISEVFEQRPSTETSQVTPDQVADGLEQFFALAQRVDLQESAQLSMLKNDVSQIGEYGLSLLQDLSSWASQLELEPARQELDAVVLAAAGWIVRHRGEVRTLEPIVDALARQANHLHKPNELERLAGFMSQLIDSVAEFIRQDLEQANPGRPWRVLHLNRGIVATRSHNTALMDQIFQELAETLPGDAARFFAEGMEQMDALDYPAPVRRVMERYFDRFTRPRMH